MNDRYIPVLTYGGGQAQIYVNAYQIAEFCAVAPDVASRILKQEIKTDIGVLMLKPKQGSKDVRVVFVPISPEALMVSSARDIGNESLRTLQDLLSDLTPKSGVGVVKPATYMTAKRYDDVTREARRTLAFAAAFQTLPLRKDIGPFEVDPLVPRSLGKNVLPFRTPGVPGRGGPKGDGGPKKT